MIIENLTIESLNIPFKVSFKHNTALRKMTQSVIVCTKTSNQKIGYGEGCPREYVTAESIESCLSFFEHYKNDFLKFSDLQDIKRWLQTNRSIVDKNTAAWCAVELSLLDALGKEQSKSIEQIVGAPELTGEFHYFAILGDSAEQIFLQQTKQYKKMGFTNFKVKITGNSSLDAEKLETIRSLIPKARIRLDANNLWQTPKEVLDYLASLSIQAFAIEEPLQAKDFKQINRLSASSPIPIILDESFIKLEDFHSVDPQNIIINLRISKMGGIIRSQEIAQEANKRNIPLIIGAQVGETSILTRGALTIANQFRNNIQAQEGAFGTLLLESDITSTPICFGKNGILKVSQYLDSNQFGLQLKFQSALK